MLFDRALPILYFASGTRPTAVVLIFKKNRPVMYNQAGNDGGTMKKKIFYIIAGLFFTACVGQGASSDIIQGSDSLVDATDTNDVIKNDVAKEVQTGPTTDFTHFVDPMIGTDGQGNVVPGPMMPHGMVKFSPDTLEEGTSIHSYYYGRDHIAGFSHLHREGPGGSGNGYGQLLFMATTGELKTKPDDYASLFSHDDEVAKVGYYSVVLKDYAILAELTASRQAGVQQYTFNKAGKAHILLDLNHCKGAPLGGKVEVKSPDTIQGWAVYQVYPIVAYGVSKKLDDGTGMDKVYFVARFSRPFDGYGTWVRDEIQADSATAEGKNIGAYADYDAKAGDKVVVRVGVSMISIDQARKNLDSQIGDKGFDDIRQAAVKAWNNVLGRIEVEGGDKDKTRFYTALYHSMMQPSDYTEGNSFFSAADGQGAVFGVDSHHFYTDDWCIWDTFRTTHPLLTLIDPRAATDSAWSLVHLYKTGGWLPKCTWNATGYSRVMTGNPQFSVLAEAYAKGLTDIDAKDAWEGMYKGATQDTPNALSKTMCGYLDLGTPPEYVTLGYIPAKCDRDQSASLTLELAHADWCAAQLGRALGMDKAAQLEARGNNWKKVFNTSIGMMQQKDKAGNWVEPFDPLSGNGFTEADSWQYTWFVPQDVCGLITAMGGKAKFVTKLDEFFAKKYFTIDNEPDFHTPWLYDFAGETSKTSDRVHKVMADAYTTGPGGLPGNDDAGATSAWFVFAAMGIYPVNPPDTRYWMNAPLFSKVTIHTDPRDWGKKFVINANGAPLERFIESAMLNGKALDRPWITHKDLLTGGSLTLKLSKIATKWAETPVCK